MKIGFFPGYIAIQDIIRPKLNSITMKTQEISSKLNKKIAKNSIFGQLGYLHLPAKRRKKAWRMCISQALF